MFCFPDAKIPFLFQGSKEKRIARLVEGKNIKNPHVNNSNIRNNL